MEKLILITFFLALFHSACPQNWYNEYIDRNNNNYNQDIKNQQWNRNEEIVQKGPFFQQGQPVHLSLQVPNSEFQKQKPLVPPGPFVIRQPTRTNNGETILENLIGGISFNCQGKPTGHHRDTQFCDIFHACVFGQQKKTYSCPFVGENTYFDDTTRRCEFVRNKPAGCPSNAYLSL